jgi:hypothetical protein
MGIKTIIIGMVFTPDHHAAAAKAAINLESLRNGAVLHLIESIAALKIMISQMPVGDPNIATISAQIGALS